MAKDSTEINPTRGWRAACCGTVVYLEEIGDWSDF